MTILFNEIVFGPVHSRRLGISLGINLLPLHGKLCSFNCIYCECGLNESHKKDKIPSQEDVYAAIDRKLSEMKESGTTPDVITFAGNGEPTLHPAFSEIIDETVRLRDKYFPNTNIDVLTNGTTLNNPKVVASLKKINNAILKLDSAFDETVKILNQPCNKNFTVAGQVELLKAYNGKYTLQTMFVKGEYKGNLIDNSTDKEVSAWIDIVKEIKPASVMIYTIERETPVKGLKKVSINRLQEIKEKLLKETGINASVAG